MYGGLIFTFLAEIHRLDTQSMEDEELFDPVFREPKVQKNDNGRREYPPILIPCQVETDSIFEGDNEGSGLDPKSELTLVFSFTDLERLQLVHVNTKIAMLVPGDRLTAIYSTRGALVQKLIPELYLKEAKPDSFGLDVFGPKRRLLIATFESRKQSARRRM